MLRSGSEWLLRNGERGDVSGKVRFHAKPFASDAKVSEPRVKRPLLNRVAGLCTENAKIKGIVRLYVGQSRVEVSGAAALADLHRVCGRAAHEVDHAAAFRGARVGKSAVESLRFSATAISSSLPRRQSGMLPFFCHESIVVTGHPV